jgi:hypothetical protein
MKSEDSIEIADKQEQRSHRNSDDSTTLMECFLSIRRRQTPPDFSDEHPHSTPSFLLFSNPTKIDQSCTLGLKQTLSELPIPEASKKLAHTCKLRLIKTTDGYIFDSFANRKLDGRLRLSDKTIRDLEHIRVPVFDWDSSGFEEIVSYLGEILSLSGYHLKPQLRKSPTSKIVARGNGQSMFVTLKYVATAFNLHIDK